MIIQIFTCQKCSLDKLLWSAFIHCAFIRPQTTAHEGFLPHLHGVLLKAAQQALHAARLPAPSCWIAAYAREWSATWQPAGVCAPSIRSCRTTVLQNRRHDLQLSFSVEQLANTLQHPGLVDHWVGIGAVHTPCGECLDE